MKTYKYKFNLMENNHGDCPLDHTKSSQYYTCSELWSNMGLSPPFGN